MDNHTTKHCSTCKQEFPATSEYFHKSKRRKDGLHYDCKSCANAKGREKSRKYGIKPYDPIRKNGLKRCCRCREWKPETIEYFNHSANRPGGFDVYCRDCCHIKWSENAEQHKEYHAKYYSENKDKIKENDLAYRSRPEIREKKRQQAQEWRERNPDRHRANAYNWQRSNPQRVKVHSERRRTREKELPATLTPDEWRHALDYFHGCCAVCGRPAGLWHTIAMDHWIPVDAGGGTVAENIIPLCHGIGGCNNSKHNLMPDQWLVRKFGKRKAKQILKRIDDYFQSLSE